MALPLLGIVVGVLLVCLASLWRVHRRLAKQMERQQRTMREQLLELRRVNAELDQLANVKDDFLETINHQLRTPLTSIVHGLELMEDGTVGSLTEDQHAIVAAMNENARRLNGLIEEVLDLSRLKSGRRPLTRTAADLGALLRRTQEAWRGMALDRTIRLEGGPLPPVYMDASAVQEVLDHLVRNALRHAPERSEIGLEATVQGEVVQVSVRDQGPGMSPEQMARLFQPFVHLHTPDAPGSEGAGLGLSVCQQIIERHRGTIRAEGTPGQGTTVHFTLPLVTPRFLFEEACRTAQEGAEVDEGQFGLLLFAPATEPGHPADGRGRRGSPDGEAGGRLSNGPELLRRAEATLRANTHRRDQFVWLDPRLLAIVAVTGRQGLEAMSARLQGILGRHGFTLRSAAALAPADGRDEEALLAAACRRLGVPVPDLGVSPQCGSAA